MSRRLRNGATLQDRIDRYVRVDGNGCWIWTALLDGGGYGKTKMSGRMWSVHRLTYAAANGPIPEGFQVDHLCRVRACCNPAHLEAVTPTENIHRSEAPAAINRRKTHCNREHELAGDNLHVDSRGTVDAASAAASRTTTVGPGASSSAPPNDRSVPHDHSFAPRIRPHVGRAGRPHQR